MSEIHEVIYDPTFSGHERWTCNTCNGKALVKQPYMSKKTWETEMTQFLLEHPHPITSMDYINLIGDITEAKVPDRSLDARIYCLLNGYRYLSMADSSGYPVSDNLPHFYVYVMYQDKDGGSHERSIVQCFSQFPQYTSDLNVMAALVKMGGWYWSVHERDTSLGPHTGEGYVHNGELHGSGKYVGFDYFGHTPELAFCIAALNWMNYIRLGEKFDG